MKLFRTKSIEDIINKAKKSHLHKSLGSLDLILMGIGAIIGTGIFVMTGIGAAKYAGPAITISYLFAALACTFAALSYAELASMIPVAGSAYTYSYVVLGEFIAWLVGWILVLEYTFASATVAAGWSGYMVGILKTAGFDIPQYLTIAPSEGGLINLPAALISLFIGALLFRGVKESIVLNRILVIVKLVIIALFIIVAAPKVQMENFSNFLPFGWKGVFVGASTIFFAYLGFDAVSTAAEECKNPQRDLPIGIIGSLVICAFLYMGVALVLTGVTNYTELNNAEPVAYSLRQNGNNITAALVALGAIAGMMSVMLVMMFGQSRIYLAMARDGLLPKAFSKIHPKFETPYISCNIVTISVALIAGLTPIHILGHITSFGTLVVFVIVAFGVLILRIKKPNLPRSFKCPLVFVTAPIGIIACGYLMYDLLASTAKPFAIWLAIGLVIYFSHGHSNSLLNDKHKK